MSFKAVFCLRILFGTMLVFGTLTPCATAQSIQAKEALELAFPEAKVVRTSVTLDKKQRKAAEKLAGKKLASAKVRAYRATREGKWLGTAYFDTRKVRSKGQTLMFVVSPSGTISRIETIRFDEPKEYAASVKWQATLLGKKLDSTLKIKGSINNLTGATLTAHATIDAARSVLAVHAILHPVQPPKPPKKVARTQSPQVCGA